MTKSALAGLVVAAGLAVAAPAHAITILSNLPGSFGGGTGLISGDDKKAVGLTVGADDLAFSSFTAVLELETAPGTLTGGIYDNSGTSPGSLLMAFVPIAYASTSGPSEVTFTTATSFVMTSGATYWFTVDGSDGQSRRWSAINPNTAPTASPEVTYNGYAFSVNGGATWSDSGTFNAMRIEAEVFDGTEVPEPATLTLLGGALLGAGVARRRRAA